MTFGSIEHLRHDESVPSIDRDDALKTQVISYITAETIPGLDDMGRSLLNSHLTQLTRDEQKQLIKGVQQQLTNRGYTSIGTIDGLGGLKTKRALRMVKTIQLIGNQDISTVDAVTSLLAGYTKAQIQDMQQLMYDEGFVIQVDGKIGPETTEALQAFVGYREALDVSQRGIGDECTSFQDEIIQGVEQQTRTLSSFEEQMATRQQALKDPQLKRMQEYREKYPQNFVPKNILDTGQRFGYNVLGLSEIQTNQQLSDQISQKYRFGLSDFEYASNVNYKNFLNDLETFYGAPKDTLYTLMIAENKGKRVGASSNNTSFGIFQINKVHKLPLSTMNDPVLAGLAAIQFVMPGGEMNPNGLNDVGSIMAAYNGGNNRMYSPKPFDPDKVGANQGKPFDASTLRNEPVKKRYAIISTDPYREGWTRSGIPTESIRHALKGIRITDPQRFEQIAHEANQLGPKRQQALADIKAAEARWSGPGGRREHSLVNNDEDAIT